MEGYSSLPAKEPRAHIDSIIGWALFESIDVPFVLHLLRLEVVAGIIFIATRYRDNM